MFREKGVDKMVTVDELFQVRLNKPDLTSRWSKRIETFDLVLQTRMLA